MHIILRRITDPPSEGEAKLRLESDGTLRGTRLYAIDHTGTKLAAIGLRAASWTVGGEVAKASIDVIGVELAVDVPIVAVSGDTASAEEHGGADQ